MYLGVEIGGTTLQIGVCDRRGRITKLVREPVNRPAGAAGIRRQILRLAPPLLRGARAIGVGFGGPVDVERGRAIRSHQIDGWDGFPMRRWFERKFGLPVAVENDTNCAALAEARIGAGRGCRVVLYSNIGTGIGGGLVIDGQLYNGRFGAMEIGHTKFGGRTVESMASGLAIERGDSTIEEAARWYGVALANAITLLNPEVVVIGGGVAQAGAKFWRPLRATVRELVFLPFRGNCRLVPAKLGQGVVVVGAALLARHRADGGSPCSRR